MNNPTAPAQYFQTIAFVVYPVKNVTLSRVFYEGRLGLKVAKQWEDNWVEYDIGQGTLAITAADEKRLAGRHGPTIAIEVGDFEALVQSLKDNAVQISDGPWDSPACRGCIVRDPDGNEIILHKIK